MRKAVLIPLVFAACSSGAPDPAASPVQHSPVATVATTSPRAAPSGIFVANLVPYTEPNGLSFFVPDDWLAERIELMGGVGYAWTAPDRSGAFMLHHRRSAQRQELAALLSQQESYLEQLTDREGPLTVSRIRLATGDAGLFRLTRTRPRRELVSQYFFTRGNDVYSLNLLAIPEAADRFSVMFAAIVASLAWSS